MGIGIDGITAALTSHAETSGLFDQVAAHEAKNAPGNGLSCEVFLKDFGMLPNRSGLGSVSARLGFNVRVRTSFVSTPEDGIDPELIKAVDSLMADYTGAFTLGGLVAAVDLLGIAGTPVAGQAGYLTQDGKVYRVVDIVLQLLVDDLWTEAP